MRLVFTERTQSYWFCRRLASSSRYLDWIYWESRESKNRFLFSSRLQRNDSFGDWLTAIYPKWLYLPHHFSNAERMQSQPKNQKHNLKSHPKQSHLKDKSKGVVGSWPSQGTSFRSFIISEIRTGERLYSSFDSWGHLRVYAKMC